MKKINVAALLTAGAIAIFGLAGCGSKVTSIEVNQYVEIEYEGYDSVGQITKSEFDARKLLNDNEKPLEEVSKKDILKLFGETFAVKTGEKGLSNGDTIQVNWEVDEDEIAEFEKEHKVKFVYDDFELEVSGLTEMEKVDVFEGITVEFGGTAPDGYARIRYNSVAYDLEFSLDKNSELSNGDVVTVTAHTYNGTDIAEFMANAYQKRPVETTKTFTVSGLAARVTALSEISDAFINGLNTEYQGKLAETAKTWKYPESFQKATFMGNIFSVNGNRNTLYFVYKVDVDSVRDGASAYYTYGTYSDIMVDTQGALSVSGSSAVNCRSSFTENGLRFYGYKTYEELVESLNNPDVKQEKKVDTSIITKVTHEPKDYSKVTATPDFEADCFEYRMVDGSYMVTSFSEKGYNLIHSFTENDCISIKLPAATPDGNVVEGFYSQKENKKNDYTFEGAFDDNAPCYELVCPDSYTKFYGFGDFQANYKLRNIVLGKGINTMKEKTFRGCTGISKLTIPDGVDEIPKAAFENCTLLTEVVIPAGVVKIGDNAFSGCTNLSKAELPAAIAEIGSFAFNNCGKLSIPTIEISGKKIGNNAFCGVTIGSVTFTENGYSSQRYTSWGTLYATWKDAHIAELVLGEGLVSIPNYAFEYCTEITSVVIPEGVTEIGEGAFSNCTALESVTLPASLIKIAKNAFDGCAGLKSINLPEEVVTIEEYAFRGCASLVVDRFDMSGKTIGTQAFENVTINVLALSSENYKSTFYTNWGDPMAPWKGAIVKNIEIGPNVNRIPDYAFAYCGGLTDVVLPDNVTEIGTSAFEGCETMKSIVIPEGVYGIDDCAFLRCKSLKTAEIPAATGYLGKEAFNGCSSLILSSLDFTGRKVNINAFREVTINELKLSGNSFECMRYTNWGDVYSQWGGATVKNIVITEDVTEIPDYAFEFVTSVVEIRVPATVTKIGKEAFGNCTGLRKIHLPAGLKNIDSSAMKNCTDVVVYAPEGSVAKKFADEQGFFFRNEEEDAAEAEGTEGETETEGEAETGGEAEE